MYGKSISKAASALAFTALSLTSWAQVSVPAGGNLTVPSGGAMELGCTSLNVSGSFSLNAGQVNGAGGVSIGTGGSVNGGSGTFNVSGNWSNSGSFAPGTGSVVFNDGCASGPIAITGSTVFNNLILGSNNGRTFIVPEGSNITVNGTLTLQGALGQPITLASSGSGTAVINLGPSAQVVRNHANVNGNVQIGAVTPSGSTTSIPTLGEWALAALAMAIGLMAFMNRRQFKR